MKVEVIQRKLCGDCRYYLKFYGTKDDQCVNPESPKFDISISDFDSCPPEFWEKKRHD